jgi:hypothetical protein
VVVGAVITGGAGYFMARRAERRSRRASLRLIAHELSYLDLQMQPRDSVLVSTEPPVRIDVLAGFTLDLWNEHRKALAETLDDRDWVAISNAYAVLELFTSLGEELTIDRITPSRMAVFRNGAAAIRRAAGLAEDYGVSPFSYAG